MSQRQKAFELFSQGFGPSSDEVKKAVRKHGTRWSYWDQYRKQTDVPIEGVTEVEEPEGDEVEVETKVKPTEPKLKAPYKVSPKEISIGNIKIPYSDWGYSSVFNLLVVAATYEEVRKPSKDGGIGYPGKVGDFCAECVKLYRRIFDFDRIKEEEYAGQGVQQIPGRIEEENNE